MGDTVVDVKRTAHQRNCSVALGRHAAELPDLRQLSWKIELHDLAIHQIHRHRPAQGLDDLARLGRGESQVRRRRQSSVQRVFHRGDRRQQLVGLHVGELGVDRVGHGIGTRIHGHATALLPAVNLRRERIELNDAMIQRDRGAHAGQHGLLIDDGANGQRARARRHLQEAGLRGCSGRGIGRGNQAP